MRKEEQQHIKRESMYDYEGLEYAPIGARQNLVYGTFSTQLHRSTDFGKTWSLVPLSIGKTFTACHITLSGNVLVWSQTPVQLFHSEDGINFDEVDISEFQPVYRPLHHGCDDNGDVVNWAEYNGDGVENTRVFRSTDGGKTWAVGLEVPVPYVRHLHSCQYLGSSRWIATTGDADTQCRWFRSNNDGATWEDVGDLGDQRWRVLSMVLTEKDYLIWGSDASTINAGIFKCHIDDPHNIETIYPMPHACWGLVGRGTELVAIFSVETNYNDDANAYIYRSMNGGKTWELDLKWQLDDTAEFGGFTHIWNLRRGSFILHNRNTEKRVAGVKMTRLGGN